MFIDSPKPYQWYLQDVASNTTAGMHDLHNIINFYLLLIIISVIYLLIITIYSSSLLSSKYLSHGKLLELVWTISPAILLLIIAFPSFRLLYLLDEVVEPALTVKVIGHQWYWSVELSDYVSINDNHITFDSYIVPTDSLIDGQNRLLEVDNSLVLPVDTNVRLIVTSSDVIHDLAIPSLSLKIDAIPSRLNQTSTLINRVGRFYGQCSELCGAEHGFIPFCIQSLPINDYLIWLDNLVNN